MTPEEEANRCGRCGAPDTDLDFILQDYNGQKYHAYQSGCIRYQSKRIAELEKQVARAFKAISDVEATAEMLNAVVGRML
jgi:hypothetical protein